jgi:ferric-dicitrate binding protein FerR (iron transport regulator)
MGNKMNGPDKYIDELIVKSLTGDISPVEKKELNIWVEKSDENSAYFGQMDKVWNKSEALESFLSVDVEADFEQFKSKVGMNTKSVRLPLYRSVIKIAAVMIPAILIVAAYGLYENVAGFGKWEAFASSDAVENVVLADASEVSLNANSRLVYEKGLSGAERRLKLEGEGYFKVAKNPDRPFIVKIGNAEVKVLGTEFNLEENSNTGCITLAVTEGRVLFSSDNEAIEVVAGEKAVFNKSGMKKSLLLSENCIAWKTGNIVFENAPLSEVLETMVDHFKEVEAIENNSTESELRITSRFSNPSLEDVLVELRIHFKKKFEINDNKLIISD